MQRFAICYAPAAHTPLWQFGCSVLGYDASTGMDVAYPDHAVFADPESLAYTAAPRRYGFHARLKAPFGLAPGHDAEALIRALDRFAAMRAPFAVTLKLATVGRRFALVPVEPVFALDRLAEACVRDFDRFRAPLTAMERERRHPARLGARELDNLERWGDPFVFDEFRFHLSLSGALEIGDRLRFEPVLHELFRLIPQVASIDALTLFVQDDPENRFRARERFAFRGA